jgi:hypothetical protein
VFPFPHEPDEPVGLEHSSVPEPESELESELEAVPVFETEQAQLFGSSVGEAL